MVHFSYSDLSPKQLLAWRTEEMENAIKAARWNLDVLNAAHPLDLQHTFSQLLDAGRKLGHAKAKAAA